MFDKYLPFTIVTSALILLAILIIIRKLMFLKNAVLVQGVVINVGAGTMFSGSRGAYFQNVEFENEKGKTFTVTAMMGSTFDRNSEGAVVDVLYNKDSPEKAVIKDFKNIWGFEVILFLIGAGMVAVIFSQI